MAASDFRALPGAEFQLARSPLDQECLIHPGDRFGTVPDHGRPTMPGALEHLASA
jgi:hypothetical protein